MFKSPLVEFVQQNKNKLIYQFTTFGEVDGKPNGLKHLQRISGIESVQQLGSKIQEGRKFVERYEIAVLEKDSEYVKHRDVRFAITDRRGERTEESVRIQY